MENTIIFGNKRTLTATLFGVAVMVFGGYALAATAPIVAPLKFEYKATDANGKIVTLENKITAGYEANKVAVDKAGNVYVADAVLGTVSIFNTNGRLTRQINVSKAIAVGVDGDNFKYVSGALNDGRGIFVFDNNDKGAGNLGTNWGQPGGINIFDAKSRDSSRGDKDYDIYVVDTMFNKANRMTLDADKSIVETKDYGPYGGERYASESWYYYPNSYTYERTRRRVLLYPAVGVDAANGLIYIAASEIIEYLSKTPSTLAVSCSRGEAACTSGSDTNYMLDTESWQDYNGTMSSISTDGTISSTTIATDSTYIYWNPIDPLRVPAAVKSYVLVIDMSTGAILRKISSGFGDGASGFHPRGLVLDGNGRLYVAGIDVSLVGSIKVYDVTVNPETQLTVSGFTTGGYMTIAYSPDTADSAKGRLFAAMADGKNVSPYSIDGGTNPANAAPAAPVLLEPVSSNTAVATVNTATPTLRIKNSTDAQNDPLTYGYEVCSGSCTAAAPNIITSATGVAGGSNNNETSMMVTQELVEDSLYHWRAQSFDGELAAWSDEATFCVNEANALPSQPAVIAPKGEIVSPFASSLSWAASTDPDCSNDIVTYDVTVSDVQGNIVKSFSGIGSTSVKISDISGLINGGIYNWAVRAADNKGGKSEYGSGSFIYMTTTVKFDSDQAGTKVYIDGNYGYYGNYLGETPVERSDIKPGSHFVTFIKVPDIDKGGYEPYYAIIKVTDPTDDLANSSVSYTAAMAAASRIKPPATGGTIKDGSGGDITAAANSTPFVVDYNNDGVKDMVVGGGDGKVYLYLSEKQTVDGADKIVPLVSKGAIQADGSDINVGSRAVPFMVDYDGDGNQDFLVGSGDGAIYLYKGSKDGFAAAEILALKDGNGNELKGTVANAAPAVVDYNNDGKKDLVVGSSDGTLRLYSNTGSDESPEFGLPAAIKADGSDINAGSDSKTFFTDWNSDGKKDIVVGDGSGKASLFFNVGTDEAPEFKSISGLLDWIKAKKKLGSKGYANYLGYTQDLGDLTGGKFEGSPFVLDWDGTSARDVIMGNGAGGVAVYITE